jgi:hypothetical protein
MIHIDNPLKTFIVELKEIEHMLKFLVGILYLIVMSDVKNVKDGVLLAL